MPNSTPTSGLDPNSAASPSTANGRRESRRESKVGVALEALVRTRRSTAGSTKIRIKRNSSITQERFEEEEDGFALELPTVSQYDRRKSRVSVALTNLVQKRSSAGGVSVESQKSEKKESTLSWVLSSTHEWLKNYSSITQIHGVRWYNLAPNTVFRGFFVLFFLTFIVALPVYFTNEGFLLYNSLSLNKKIQWNRDLNLTYPNLTVCFAKFFDNNLLRAENISNEMANYMTMALDPNVGQLVKYMQREIPGYGDKLIQLENELNSKLAESNITILELFHKVAIRCENFVTLCEVHSRFLFSTPDQPPDRQCCGKLFNPRPFFSNTGTCFTTDATIHEHTPFTISSVKVWLNMQSNNSPEFDLIYKGSDALERRGAFYTVSDLDHPITKLMQSPYKVPRKSNVLISLSTRELDRTGVTKDVFCQSNTEKFEQHYKVDYTKLNCDFFANTGLYHQCSLSPYFGVTPVNEDPPCKPNDFFNSTPYFNEKVFQAPDDEEEEDGIIEYGVDDIVCLPACLRREYSAKITEGLIDGRAIKRYAKMTNSTILGDPDDLVVLQMYFSSFDYETHTFYKATLVDLLSKIGGWLGIINGSSIISVSELFILYFIFVFKLAAGRGDD